MKLSLQRIVGTLSIPALFLSLLTGPIPMRASANTQIQTVTAGSLTSYSFNAGAGDSLSRIVRRALQLRGVTDQPSAMYCENLIATDLGGGYLEIDQQVVVSFAQIDACVAAAKGLDANARAAWQAYADTAVFDVSDINPTNNSSAVVTPQPSEPAPVATPSQPPVPPKNEKPSATPAQPAKPIEKQTLKKAAAYLWYVAAAFVLIYFVADGPLPHRRVRR